MGPIPYTSDSTVDVDARTPTRPSPTPQSARRAARRTTRRTIPPLPAPRAIRMPSSRTRLATKYDTVPWIPAAARKIAATAKSPIRVV